MTNGCPYHPTLGFLMGLGSFAVVATFIDPIYKHRNMVKWGGLGLVSSAILFATNYYIQNQYGAQVELNKEQVEKFGELVRQVNATVESENRFIELLRQYPWPKN